MIFIGNENVSHKLDVNIKKGRLEKQNIDIRSDK